MLFMLRALLRSAYCYITSLDNLVDGKPSMDIGLYSFCSCGVGGLNALWNHCWREFGDCSPRGKMGDDGEH